MFICTYIYNVLFKRHEYNSLNDNDNEELDQTFTDCINLLNINEYSFLQKKKMSADKNSVKC